MTTAEILSLIALILSVITLGVALLIFIKVKSSPVVKVEQNEDAKNQLTAIYTAINAQSKAIYDQEIRLTTKLSESNFSTEARINALKDKLDSELKYMLSNNDRNLERIRMTVEEKLSQTLEGTLPKSCLRYKLRPFRVYRTRLRTPRCGK